MNTLNQWMACMIVVSELLHAAKQSRLPSLAQSAAEDAETPSTTFEYLKLTTASKGLAPLGESIAHSRLLSAVNLSGRRSLLDFSRGCLYSARAKNGNGSLRYCCKHAQQRCVQRCVQRCDHKLGSADEALQTRITTKYNIPNLDSPKYQKTKKRKRETDGEDKDAPAAPRVPRATLTLKTYDPESGVVLKFKTDRAAEVGRLIGSLGRVGRYMAALPEKEEGETTHTPKPTDIAKGLPAQDTVPEDVPAIEQAADSTLPTSDSKPQSGAGGGKKKKNKGKK